MRKELQTEMMMRQYIRNKIRSKQLMGTKKKKKRKSIN